MNGLGYITRGWEVSGTTSLQSGAPITPFIGGLDTNGDGNTANGLPFAGTRPKTQIGMTELSSVELPVQSTTWRDSTALIQSIRTLAPWCR